MGELRGLCLSKREIFREKKGISELLENGRRFEGEQCRILFLPYKGRKVIFMVGKKVGKAVRRNTIRRWLREVYRKNRRLAGSNFAMAIMVKRNQTDISYKKLESDIVNLFQKINKTLMETTDGYERRSFREESGVM